MKSYCILEQGRSVGDPFTSYKKNLFTTSFSDFYRLNWDCNDDHDAFIRQKDIVWSEGRALLYHRVPKVYDYYIFTDDDIVFSTSAPDLAKKIKIELEHYQPITGTFIDDIRFTSADHFNFLGKLKHNDCHKHRAFPTAGYDQQVQIFSKSYAKCMFPSPFHGAGMSMWYAQWICSQQFPQKQLCFTEVQIKNTRMEKHENESNMQHLLGAYLVKLFNKHVLLGNYNWNLSEIQRANEAAFKLQPDLTPVDYTLEHMALIYDINNPFFQKRAPIVENKVEYRKEVENYLPFSGITIDKKININAIEIDKQDKESMLR